MLFGSIFKLRSQTTETERAEGALLGILILILLDRPNWPKYLPTLVFVIASAFVISLGYYSMELVFAPNETLRELTHYDKVWPWEEEDTDDSEDNTYQNNTYIIERPKRKEVYQERMVGEEEIRELESSK